MHFKVDYGKRKTSDNKNADISAPFWPWPYRHFIFASFLSWRPLRNSNSVRVDSIFFLCASRQKNRCTAFGASKNGVFRWILFVAKPAVQVAEEAEVSNYGLWYSWNVLASTFFRKILVYKSDLGKKDFDFLKVNSFIHSFNKVHRRNRKCWNIWKHLHNRISFSLKKYSRS